MSAPPVKASAFEVDPHAVQDEARFYDDADGVYDHLERCKRSIAKEDAEFEQLMTYFTRNRAHIDLEYRSPTRLGDAAQRPNLGTDDASWYYLDERGNRIWVRNLTLDLAKAMSFGGSGTMATGAFEETEYADGRHVVVRVPKPKRHHNHPADYRRRCVEAEAEWAARYGATVPVSGDGTLDAARSTGWAPSAHGGTAAYGNTFRGSYTGGSARGGAAVGPHDDAYIAAQRDLAKTIAGGAKPRVRTPATIEEAEARLEELRREEQALLKAMRGGAQ